MRSMNTTSEPLRQPSRKWPPVSTNGLPLSFNVPANYGHSADPAPPLAANKLVGVKNNKSALLLAIALSLSLKHTHTFSLSLNTLSFSLLSLWPSLSHSLLLSVDLTLS